jgi:hypothetical protein
MFSLIWNFLSFVKAQNLTTQVVAAEGISNETWIKAAAYGWEVGRGGSVNEDLSVTVTADNPFWSV